MIEYLTIPTFDESKIDCNGLHYAPRLKRDVMCGALGELACHKIELMSSCSTTASLLTYIFRIDIVYP